VSSANSRPPVKARYEKKKRVGRGESSGWGKTSGGGGKGQTVRSGAGKPRVASKAVRCPRLGDFRSAAS
jgi:ribosomal protein L15